MLVVVRALANCIVPLLIGSIGAAPAQAQQAPTPGKASFNVFLRGTPVGTEDAVISSAEDGWILQAAARFTPPIDLVVRRYEMRFDREWNPRELTLEGVRAGRAYTLRSTFANGSATTEFNIGSEAAQSKTDSVLPSAVVLPVSLFAPYEVLAVRLSGSTEGDELAVYVPSQGQMPLRVNQVLDEQIRVGDRTISVRRYRVGILHPAAPFDAEVWVDSESRLLRLTLPLAEVDVVRTDIVSTSTRFERFRHPGDEDIRIPGAGFSIAATITRPGEADGSSVRQRSSAGWPAVVLVPPTSTNDRDATVSGVPVLGQLAGALADRGFIAVRYDRRGFGQSGGRAEAATLQDYAADVRAIFEYLESQEDIDRKKIAVAGYDEGGWIALLAAARERDIKAVTLIATASTTGAELTLEQQLSALDRLKVSDDERDEKIELQKKIHDAVLGGEWEGIAAEVRRQADNPWFKSFLSFDPARTMERVRQPVFVVHGTLDRQVPEYHAERLAELARGRDRDVPSSIARIEGVNHLLVLAETGGVEEYASLTDRSVSTDVADAVAEWLRRTLGIHLSSARHGPTGFRQAQSPDGALAAEAFSR